MFPVVAHVASAGEKVSAFSISPRINELLESYCFSCHDGETREPQSCRNTFCLSTRNLVGGMPSIRLKTL